MDVRQRVNRIKKKYGTSDPYEIASGMGILVLFENLGNMNGYYNKPYRIKQIHINYNLSDHLQKFTCAHELGHCIQHPNVNTMFLRNNTLLSVNKYEIEANRFAIELLLPDEMLLEYRNMDFTVEQIARITGYHKKLIELKEIFPKECRS